MPAKTHHRKKTSRQRGSRSHGWGAKKKHRGKGNKGGSGMAGRGKHGGSRRTMVKYPKEYYGKHGFTSRAQAECKTGKIISTQDVAQKLVIWVKTGKASQDGKMVSVDLTAMGYTKLVAKGRAAAAAITVGAASEGAIKKVEAAGGKVILPAGEPSKE